MAFKLTLNKYGFGDNLAAHIPKEELKKIGQKAILGYDADEGSRSDWKTRYANWIKLFTALRTKKNFPWENCSNVGLTALATAIIQFHARALEALLPGKDIVKGAYTGREDSRAAQRIAKFMNWQLIYDMDEFEDSMDTTLMQLPLNGMAIRKTYRDPIKKRNVTDYVSPIDFAVAYNTKRLSDAERMSQILRPTIDDIKVRERDKIYINTEGLVAENNTNLPGSSEVTAEVDKSTGHTPSTEITRRVLIEQHTKIDLDGDGIGEDVIMVIDYKTKTVLRLVLNMNPDTGEKVGIYTNYIFIPNPESGVYGMGFGMLLEGAVESMNSIINQLSDSGTLANMQSGFASRSLGTRGRLKFAMGQFQEINLLGGSKIQDHIMPFNFKEPSHVLLSLLGILQEYVDRLTTVTELTTGGMPRSDTPVGTTEQILEQGMKVFSNVHRRTHRSFRKELRKLYDLNGLYLNLEEYKQILGEEFNTEEDMAEMANDFKRPFDVMPVSDAQFTSQMERLSKAQTVYQVVNENPWTQKDPQVMSNALMDFLTAMRVEDPSRYQFQIPNQEQQQLPPEEEEKMFLGEQEVSPHPDDDHEAHLLSHEDFANREAGQHLSDKGRKILELHMRETMGFMHQKEVVGGDRDVGME